MFKITKFTIKLMAFIIGSLKTSEHVLTRNGIINLAIDVELEAAAAWMCGCGGK